MTQAVLKPPAKDSLPVLLLAAQAVLLYAGISWAAMTVSRRDADRALPPLREKPLAVRPLNDDPQIVTDEQLQRVLHKLRPKLRGDKPRVNDLDHALRCWGVEAKFDNPDCFSGEELRELLLDSRKLAALWGDKEPALLSDSGIGIRTRVQQGAATASHVDHVLAVQAEIGSGLDQPVVTLRRSTTLRAVLEQSLRDFSLNQAEYEWSALAYALYLPPTTEWTTSEGQHVSFDRIAERLMRQAPAQGVCYGNHRLHGLVMLLRVDEETPLLTAETRRQTLDYLADMTRQFVANQHADGYFNGAWPRDLLASSGTQAVPADSLSGRLLATGHVMEWWALAPREVHPPRESLVRAGQWLSRTIDELSDEQVRSNYTFLSHACRALAMWRGHLPAELLPPSAAE